MAKKIVGFAKETDGEMGINVLPAMEKERSLVIDAIAVASLNARNAMAVARLNAKHAMARVRLKRCSR